AAGTEPRLFRELGLRSRRIVHQARAAVLVVDRARGEAAHHLAAAFVPRRDLRGAVLHGLRTAEHSIPPAPVALPENFRAVLLPLSARQGIPELPDGLRV